MLLQFQNRVRQCSTVRLNTVLRPSCLNMCKRPQFTSTNDAFRIIDPGFCNTNLQMIHVKVDMSLPANQDLKPELEENEFIEVFTVPLSELWSTCRQLEKEGFAIDARVGTLAEGIELGKQWKC